MPDNEAVRTWEVATEEAGHSLAEGDHGGAGEHLHRDGLVAVAGVLADEAAKSTENQW
jgi:hypothetical protein